MQLAALFVENDGAGHSVSTRKKIDDSRVRFKPDIGERRGLLIKRARDFVAGGIAVRMKNAAAAMRAFAGKDEFRAFAVRLAVELGAPANQFLNSGRSFFDQRVHGTHVT